MNTILGRAFQCQVGRHSIDASLCLLGQLHFEPTRGRPAGGSGSHDWPLPCQALDGGSPEFTSRVVLS